MLGFLQPKKIIKKVEMTYIPREIGGKGTSRYLKRTTCMIQTTTLLYEKRKYSLVSANFTYVLKCRVICKRYFAKCCVNAIYGTNSTTILRIQKEQQRNEDEENFVSIKHLKRRIEKIAIRVVTYH
jgi:hypothetical protein